MQQKGDGFGKCVFHAKRRLLLHVCHGNKSLRKRVGFVNFVALFFSFLCKSFCNCQHFAKTEVTMNYIYQFFYFLKTYDNFVMPILFLLVVAFGLVNWLCNPYRRQNKKFAKCTEKLLHPNTCNEQSLRILPKEYQRQWRAFVRSGASKPSQTLEFVPCKNPRRFLLVIVLGGLLSVGYGVLFFEDFSNTSYAWFVAVFAISLALVLIVNAQINYLNKKHAQQRFAKFVLQLNKSVMSEHFSLSAKRKAVDHAISVIERNKSCAEKQQIVQSVADVLREKGLNGVRTADEQRRINQAINNLLQTYARQSK